MFELSDGKKEFPLVEMGITVGVGRADFAGKTKNRCWINHI